MPKGSSGDLWEIQPNMTFRKNRLVKQKLYIVKLQYSNKKKNNKHCIDCLYTPSTDHTESNWQGQLCIFGVSGRYSNPLPKSIIQKKVNTTIDRMDDERNS